MLANYGKETSMRNLTAEELKIVSGAGRGHHGHHGDDNDKRRHDDDEGFHKVKEEKEKEKDDKYCS
jgi:hypothetical protein